MKKTINDYIKEAGLNPKESTWLCKGKTIVLHKTLERIADHLDIGFELPQVIQANSERKEAAVILRGYIPKETDENGKVTSYRYEWTFGEAAPYNNTNGYPFAMAEKRAKDRIILKILGVYGEVYSEEEADEFKQARFTKVTGLTGKKVDDIIEQGNEPDISEFGF